jgi:hypothetical protein
MLTNHEPGTPGGETPPSTAGETPAATDSWFTGRIEQASPSVTASRGFMPLAWGGNHGHGLTAMNLCRVVVGVGEMDRGSARRGPRRMA